MVADVGEDWIKARRRVGRGDCVMRRKTLIMRNLIYLKLCRIGDSNGSLIWLNFSIG